MTFVTLYKTVKVLWKPSAFFIKQKAAFCNATDSWKLLSAIFCCFIEFRLSRMPVFHFQVPIELRVLSDRGNRLMYSTMYGNTQSPRYVEIVDKFINDVGTTAKKTPLAPQYVTAAVNYITTPKVKNRSANLSPIRR